MIAKKDQSKEREKKLKCVRDKRIKVTFELMCHIAWLLASEACNHGYRYFIILSLSLVAWLDKIDNNNNKSLSHSHSHSHSYSSIVQATHQFTIFFSFSFSFSLATKENRQAKVLVLFANLRCSFMAKIGVSGKVLPACLYFVVYLKLILPIH